MMARAREQEGLNERHPRDEHSKAMPYATSPQRLSDCTGQTELSRTISHLSVGRWGERRIVRLLGHHPNIADAQQKVLHFAQSDAPVLITGETGTGKELLARALYLLSARSSHPLICVNCAQYRDGNLLVSELFGHRKGSFTGATEDRRGVFEEADGGVVFLDEIAELCPTAQAILLRTLSEGEVVRVGESRARSVDVRIVAATARPLEQLVAAGAFRDDLFYRLRFLRINVPPLRERGDDWALILDDCLRQLNHAQQRRKRFTAASLLVLRSYPWPGNVRELKGIADLAFFTCNGDEIEPGHFSRELAGLQACGNGTRVDARPVVPALPTAPSPDDMAARCLAAIRDGGTFWSVVYEPFIERDLNRSQVRAVIAAGLAATGGSYKHLLSLLRVDASSYVKFMDFLRHHRLKPDSAIRERHAASIEPQEQDACEAGSPS